MDGSLRSPGTGPSTGLSVSMRRVERGSRLTSFCFCLDRTTDGGMENMYPALDRWKGRPGLSIKGMELNAPCPFVHEHANGMSPRGPGMDVQGQIQLQSQANELPEYLLLKAPSPVVLDRPAVEADLPHGHEPGPFPSYQGDHGIGLVGIEDGGIEPGRGPNGGKGAG